MSRWRPLLVCALLVLAGCGTQPTLRDTPERPDELTNRTMVDYAVESERVSLYNRIIENEGGVEGDLNVTCHGRPLYTTSERAVVTVACFTSPYVANGAHVETWPHFSLHVFHDGTTSVVRPSEARTVVLNESDHTSLWIANSDASDRSVTARLLSENASNATVLDGQRLPSNEGVRLIGVPDRATNWLRVEVGEQRLRLDEWQNSGYSIVAVYIDADGTPRAVTIEYPLSSDP